MKKKFSFIVLSLPVFLAAGINLHALPDPPGDADETESFLMENAVETLTIEKEYLELDVYAWVNTMPGSGKPGIIANVSIRSTATDKKLKNKDLRGIKADCMWFLLGSRRIWITSFVNETDPGKSGLGGTARSGPFIYDEKCTVIVRVLYKGSRYYLKKENVLIHEVSRRDGNTPGTDCLAAAGFY